MFTCCVNVICTYVYLLIFILNLGSASSVSAGSDDYSRDDRRHLRRRLLHPQGRTSFTLLVFNFILHVPYSFLFFIYLYFI